MQPHAQHHTVLVEKGLLLGPLKPQRGHKPEGVYWWGCSLSLPRILTFNVYNMFRHLSLHYLMSLFHLHHNVNDVHANMRERRGQGRESCNCVFYTKWFLSWKTFASVELLKAPLWWLLSPACLTHIVWISSSAPFCSFLLQGKHSSLPFLLCKHFLVGLRKDQVPLCFLSPCCHHFRCKILSAVLIFILISVVATRRGSLKFH